MGHAWLDSLSEDWPSQPESNASSPSPAPTKDGRSKKKGSPAASITPSRIPRFANLKSLDTQTSADNSSGKILGDRSVNELFGTGSSRSLSKASNGTKSGESLSSSGSVVQHKPLGTAPRRRGSTPEWRRRLVNGNLSYGEQCDLFTSAGVGLENIFKPPTPSTNPQSNPPTNPDNTYVERSEDRHEESYGERHEWRFQEKFDERYEERHEEEYEDEYEERHEEGISKFEITLPSSPPIYPQDPSTVEIHVDDSIQELPQHPARRSQMSTRYKTTQDSANESQESGSSLMPDSCTQAPATTTEHTAVSEGLVVESRKFSGRSDIRNEDFSPILIERRQASNGQTTFGAADIPPTELQKRLEKLKVNQKYLTGGSSTDVSAEGTSDAHRKSQNSEAAAGEFEKLGAFINFRRGGRSADGSFRHRVLSASLNDTSELCPDLSLQASTPKQFPSVRVECWDESGGEVEAQDIPVHSPRIPRAPYPSPEKRSPTKKRLPPLLPPSSRPSTGRPSTGSPLKLFQPYDTFTMRRLSQFQDGGEGEQEHSFDMSDEQTPSKLPPESVGRFGIGELDGYEFHDEFSHISNEASGLEGDKENRGPEGEWRPPHSPIFDLTHDSSPSEAEEHINVVRRRRKSIASQASSRRSGGSVRDPRPSLALSDIISTSRRRETVASEIKRPRTSPSKDPTPKRRRTLHKSDVSYGVDEDAQPPFDLVQLLHKRTHSVSTKQRKETRHNAQHEMAEAELVSGRQGTRPRTPTPSSRSSLQRERPPLAEIEKSPFRSSRNSRPPTSLPTGSALDTDRKPSIRTEDFINEANKIMAMIRSKAGLASGLASLEESDAEHAIHSSADDSSYEESTQEPFDRPPSREGRPPLTRRSTKQEDPALVERLKKYEEASDMGDIIGDSVRSAKLVQDAFRAAQEHGWDHDEEPSTWGTAGTRESEPEVKVHVDEEVISDPPNMRISRNPDWQEDAHDDFTDNAPSQGSSPPSTLSSVPTSSSRGSSRGSDARKTIAPESVLHLIPDRVGNMVLDRKRNMWVKKRGSPEVRRSRANSRSNGNFLPSEASEDDPFAGIPDLSVDITMEMQNLALMTGGKDPSPKDRLPRSTTPPSPTRAPEPKAPRRPGSANAEQTNRGQRLNIPSLSIPSQIRITPPSDSETVDDEIRINEGRGKEPRRLTISFSSPIAEVIHDLGAEDDEEEEVEWEESSILHQVAEEVVQDSLRGRRIVSVQTTTKRRTSRSRSGSRGPARHLSVRGKTIMARPVSRIDEHDEESGQDQAQTKEGASGMELSILPDNSVVGHESDAGQQNSLSFLVATPGRAQGCPIVGHDGAPMISQYVGTFSLSPLSEFTMHHGEESLALEASYIVGSHHLVTGDRSKRVMTMSTRDLVNRIAEVEPFEPYWENMRELELRDKRLGSLHTLADFCGQLESLDVSNNNIRNLSGIPSTVLHLRMTNNQLSSLTAWSHLMNLQYVDISNNELTSLAAFRNLVHLRTLRIDNNQLTSLDGIKCHRGLQSLRARGNAIEELDLHGSNMEQLTELDLKGNHIRRIANLEQLTSLSSLNLDDNELESFCVDSEEPMLSLRYLRLDSNRLSTLDVRKLPHLRLLHADRNCLVQISGFSRARRIDSLSLREQHGSSPLDLEYLLSRVYEVRKLFLSGNLLESFTPTVDFLNLQLLELANCGLSSLPDDFGLLMPNLRVLNLNLNALTSLAPLRYIPRLKRLFASGNRISDPSILVATLERFQYLAVADVRDNPVTQGFYAPIQIIMKRNGEMEEGEGGEERFRLPEQDEKRDRAYCGRLDMDTRMKRRLYEYLIGRRCRRVKMLDGLEFTGVGGGGKIKDEEAWKGLMERGLVQVVGVVGNGDTNQKDQHESSRAENRIPAYYRAHVLRSRQTAKLQMHFEVLKLPLGSQGPSALYLLNSFFARRSEVSGQGCVVDKQMHSPVLRWVTTGESLVFLPREESRQTVSGMSTAFTQPHLTVAWLITLMQSRIGQRQVTQGVGLVFGGSFDLQVTWGWKAITGSWLLPTSRRIMRDDKRSEWRGLCTVRV
ncbi:hypothetical protein QBC44DRAFT_360189 [Cladorrhinum sp. PSN332]|nr:hypothetical protein QBC44DRAFT_360189 [Cladorrhinum sp. PSN332]